MNGLLFALLAVLIAGIAARDQLTLAALALRRGTGAGETGWPVTAVVVSLASAVLAAWGASVALPVLAPAARQFAAAVALVLGGGEMLLARQRRVPQEPTRSLAALAIVLFAQQLTDAARFLIFAIALATAAPVPAGIGGALGGVGSVLLGWMAPQWISASAAIWVRRGAGVLLLTIGVVVGLRATGRL